MMIISRGSLRDYVGTLVGRQDQAAVKSALDVWYNEVRRANWTNSADVKQRYQNASIVTAERIVFNIKGNDYRLVVSVDFKKGIVWIKFIGMHDAYNKIDVKDVQHGL